MEEVRRLFTVSARSCSPSVKTSSELEDMSAIPAHTEREYTTGKGGVETFEREIEHQGLAGKSKLIFDARKYKYDVIRGSSAGMTLQVTRDDRMSADEAGAKLHELHQKFGIDGHTEEILYAFDCSLWFCHTVNSGSVLLPGRAKFGVAGVTELYDYAAVRDILGPDLRRFFRAFADDVMAVNKRVLAEYDPFDIEKVERWGWLQQVALDRGLQRYPYLAHDSADAAVCLNLAERSALNKSKAFVLGSVENVADQLAVNPRVSAVQRG